MMHGPTAPGQPVAGRGHDAGRGMTTPVGELPSHVARRGRRAPGVAGLASSVDAKRPSSVASRQSLHSGTSLAVRIAMGLFQLRSSRNRGIGLPSHVCATALMLAAWLVLSPAPVRAHDGGHARARLRSFRGRWRSWLPGRRDTSRAPPRAPRSRRPDRARSGHAPGGQRHRCADRSGGRGRDGLPRHRRPRQSTRRRARDGTRRARPVHDLRAPEARGRAFRRRRRAPPLCGHVHAGVPRRSRLGRACRGAAAGWCSCSRSRSSSRCSRWRFAPTRRIAQSLYPDAALAARATLPMMLLTLAFAGLGIVLLVQPMGLRHVM